LRNLLTSAISDFFSRLSVFKKAEPVDSTASFQNFLVTRSAFVAQKKLYEYVKQRMGMAYPKAFQDDIFIESLNIAKWQVYAACMSDLAIWMAAIVHANTGNDDEAASIARHTFSESIYDRFDAAFVSQHAQEMITRFDNRLALTDWNASTVSDNTFTLSPKELVRWAPIAPDLKKYDVEIVENSIRFAWVAIREEFKRLYRHEAFIADWRAGSHKD
jgi:hypothetical protein